MNFRHVILSALVGSSLLSVTVRAEPPSPVPPQSSGPDVVVSAISSGGASAPYGDTSGGSLTTDGTVGSITAFSVATVSCNIGNADAIWIDGGAQGNRHPVIGTQIYRYKLVGGAGRFEQIGLNWLKHGFCAADGSTCTQLVSPAGAAASNGSCDWLGKFMTDTYGAGLNGAQSSLGPRSEINPWTGVYPYPYVLQWQTTGNAIFKRTQVPSTELGGGANYIVEVVYVCTDEPAPNRYNNYSYRMASSAGTSITTTGPTKQGRGAVHGWQQIDPQVRIVDIDPNGSGAAATDGRMQLAYRVTQTSTSSWHYEYALFNMNNDRGAKGFSVPVSQLVSVSGIGFHDVDYHSGEPFNGTDWSSSNSGGAVAWNMVNDNGANSNALRWGSTYSFRFDANQPPVAGNAVVTMFKAGSPATVAVTTQVPAVPPPPGPGAFSMLSPAHQATDQSLTPALSWSPSEGASSYAVTVANDRGLSSVVWSTSTGSSGVSVPAGVLSAGATYWWGVVASSDTGSTPSTPSAFSFATIPPNCQGDIDGNGHTDTSDLTILLSNFGASVPPNTGGDLNGDGTVTTSDLTVLLAGFGC